METTVQVRDLEDVRLAVYHTFRATGSGPSVASLAEQTGHAPCVVRAALLRLHRSRALVLSPGALEAFASFDAASATSGSLPRSAQGSQNPVPDSVSRGDDALALARDRDRDQGIIAMAHPFASVPLGFSVMGRSLLWWGGCAWDAFAFAHLIPEQGPLLVATRCRACSTPIALDVTTAPHPRIRR
jgi:hypothetical protein